jgi:ABC-2 type transport system ATP-binding protein
MGVVVNNVTKSFGDKIVLKVENYSINNGEIVGLVGNNGAGKTTLFRIMLDLLKPDSGNVAINDCVTNESEEWKSFTGAFIDIGFLIDYLTPDEYFSFIGKISGMSSTEINERLDAFSGFLGGELLGNNTLIRNLSAGNKQKVGIVGAMLTKPDVLILDEPFNFLDPSSQLAMKQLLQKYNQDNGATILVSSHNLSHTLDICTRVTLLEHGVIVKDADKKDVDITAEIEQYFLGHIS